MSLWLVLLYQEFYISQVVECVCTRLYNLFKNKQFCYNWCACSCSSACDKSNKANNIILCFACFLIYVPFLVWIGIENDQQNIWNAKGCHNLFTLYVLPKKSISIIQNPTFFKNYCFMPRLLLTLDYGYVINYIDSNLTGLYSTYMGK